MRYDIFKKNGSIDIGDLACDKDGLTATSSALNKIKKNYLKKIIDKFTHNKYEVDKEDRKKNEK